SASGNPIRYSPSSAIRRSQARANSKAPAKAVPEIAAITGFGMLSHSAMALSKNPPLCRVLGPLAAGSAQGLGDLDKRRNTKMTIEITGRASSNDDNPNLSVARELVKRFGEHVAHLRVEVDALCAPESDDRNSVSHFCRQNIGVHRVLLTCNAL